MSSPDRYDCASECGNGRLLRGGGETCAKFIGGMWPERLVGSMFKFKSTSHSWVVERVN
jgi:hypothetical protein